MADAAGCHGTEVLVPAFELSQDRDALSQARSGLEISTSAPVEDETYDGLESHCLALY